MTDPRQAGAAVHALMAAAVLTGALAGAVAPAHAQSYALRMTGTLDARSALVAGATATPFAAGATFTLEALFDVRSSNLVRFIGQPGFVAYTPLSAQFTVGGRSYAVQGFDDAHPTGFAVAVFDSTTPFGVRNRYGVGFIQNPLADGAGFVVDYASATTPFRIGATGLVSTTFTGYSGVGFTSGRCTSGAPPACQAYAVTPVPLTLGGQAFGLQLGSYDLHAAPGGPVFTASIAAVPEPSTLALLAAGLLGAGGVARRRRAAR